MKKLLIMALLLIVSTGATTSQQRFYDVKVTVKLDNYRQTHTMQVRASSANQARNLAVEQARRRMYVKVLSVKPNKP